MISTLLGEKYRIVRRIGSGGMGIVYEAEQVTTGQPVAVKVIHAALMALDENRELTARFEREVSATSSIASPHIARVLDVGTDPTSGSPYMVMEYLVGEDADHLFQRLGPLSPDLALRIAAQSCLGLRDAHEARIIHRDIKPANLFLARGQEGERVVKLLDFGVAKIRAEQGEGGRFEKLTRTGSMLGTPLYMSPEQARAARTVDHRSDIWSLGMVLYQALAGRSPYQGVSGLGELVFALYNNPAPPVQHFAPWVSPQITAVVDRALRIDPAQRFQTVDEMLDAIRPLLPDGLGIDDAMLTPLGEEMRARIAPVFSRDAPLSTTSVPAEAISVDTLPTRVLPLGAPPSKPLSTGATPPAKRDELAETVPLQGTPGPMAPGPPSTLALPEAAGETMRGVAAPPRATSFPVAAILLTSVVLGGIGAYVVFRPVSTRPPPNAEAIVPLPVAPTAKAAAEPSATAEPAVTAVASATAPASASPAASALKPERMPGVVRRPERGKPVASGDAKEPPRLDHSSFGDRK